jgi:hypothetical protein
VRATGLRYAPNETWNILAQLQNMDKLFELFGRVSLQRDVLVGANEQLTVANQQLIKDAKESEENKDSKGVE